ncbi:hypothetical protein OsJ_29501 [Oryza sativa Japonica Group]|uniref:Uncharacterized protein n=1 Tax=Oryza sativa subsp. japonica TaxID=39947 RepID=B9G3T6_ORYSJ|nr:hypothetical protein OsJ_29501 [Oryza sativa Japonica Group]
MGDDGGGVKVAAAAATTATGMKQITRLRELLQKWQAMALGANKGDVATAGDEEDEEVVEVAPAAAAAAAIPPFVMRRLQRTVTVDSDDESCQSPEPPADVPRGYCPGVRGAGAAAVRDPDEAEEEFGFCHQGALAIPCETEAFKYILQCVERHDNGLAAGDVVDGVVDVNDRAPPRD